MMTSRLYSLALALALAALSTACPGTDPVEPDTAVDSDTAVGTDTDSDGTVNPDVGVDIDVSPDTESDVPAPPPITDIVPVIPTCAEPPALAARSYEAKIRWTSYGVPHIDGSDLGNVAFGQAYTVARDHVCTMADQYVKARGERAKYHGPGPGNAHLQTDFGWKAIGIRAKAQCQLGQASAESREMVAGYAAGYNKYLEDTGVENLPAMCAGAAWVTPITELDVQAQLLMLVLRASADPLVGAVTAAQPPPAAAKADGAQDSGSWGHPTMPDFRKVMGDLGSNGWGIGSDRSDNGRGKLIANPHFPWEGALRLHEAQLTVPSSGLNVHGSALIGVPGVLIGFNEHLGWTHTVSASQRFTLYRLDLDADDPTVYMYEGERRRMSSREVTVDVKQGDGSTQPMTRTYYGSHYGPMINVSPLDWGRNVAYTFRDGNFDNGVFVDQFLAMNRATDLESFKDAFRNFNGIPWVNTMYADKGGNAFYVDGTPVARMSPQSLKWWSDAIDGVGEVDGVGIIASLVWSFYGAYLFDGSISEHEWTIHPDARSPGVTPFAEAPQQDRTDYVANANDSHWLTNVSAPLEGFSRLYGPEGTPRSPRTRMNMRMLTETGAEAASGADGKFDFDELKAIRTSNRAFNPEEWLGDLVTRCGGGQVVDVEGTSVDLAEACGLLAAWDGRYNVDSVGAIIFREFNGAWTEFVDFDPAKAYATPFDVAAPVVTPGGLPPADGGEDQVLLALARGVLYLQEAGLALDTPLGTAQFTKKGDAVLPIPGGSGLEGVFNVVLYSNDTTTILPKMERAPVVHGLTDLTEEGYLINYGTSFVMALEFTDDGPRAECLVTYSQSMDPASPHFKDQTELFGTDGWRPILFTEAELVADPGLTELTISVPAP